MIRFWNCLEGLSGFSFVKFLLGKFIFQSNPMNLSRSVSLSPSKSKKLKSKDERIVHRLTKNVVMKFRPEKLGQQPVSNGSFINKMRSIGKYLPFKASRETQVGSQGSMISKEANYEQLSDTYLVGNKSHADAFAISLLDEYIEVQHLWNLKLKNPISHIVVDSRRRVIVAVSTGEIFILSYQSRRSKNPPQVLKAFKITEEVKVVQFAKDMLLAVFFEKSMNFYALDGANSRQISKKQYKTSSEYEFHQPAQCVQGILNIFFVGPKITEVDKGEREKSLFGLWCLPIELTNYQVGKLKHTYDIQDKFRSTLTVQSVDKECFLLNLGRELLLFKRGYLVDRAVVNHQVDNTFLRYFSDRKVVHVSPTQIDFYNVIIDISANPPKISLKSTDSLMTEERRSIYKFMDVLRFQQNKWGIFYQIPVPNINGQIKYEFALTIEWNFEQKVSSLLPKVSQFQGQKSKQNPQFCTLLQTIKQRFDMVSKMGVTRREAYLWIWRNSCRQSIEQFNLLLDTHDYSTIRQQITNKLKQKMMQWVQVYKMQQGCLSMLADNLFSQSNYSQQGLKNYLISHMLVRKLQLFKEIKLYEKATGKIKLSDLKREKDKLMINIQEYTNTIQMDVRAYLLELIYNYCKFKKDFVKEIRITLKKFKFSFRYVYLNLLREIVDTAKQQLLFLLQNIPELLPYVPKKADEQDAQLLLGVYGEMKDEDWDRSLTLHQVMTVFNKEMVLNFSSSMWIRRNWLTYHDMIFLSRHQIQAQFKSDRQQVFYCFIQQIFEKKLGQKKQLELVNYLQDSYEQFPSHLYNNVFLYRRLYLYFFENNNMSQQFQQFLKKHDHQIFKLIFDHQKINKGSFLNKIKPIYEELGQAQKFNYGLLKFFSSALSQVSDIKYLLNRINNEKREFHAENEEMYEVLIKGMQIKLKLGSERDIPIEEVLIYLTKIPLKQGNALEQEMKVLQEINKFAAEFKEMKLDMSVFQMIRNRDTVLIKAIRHQIERESFNPSDDIELIAFKSKEYIKKLTIIRENIYGKFADNQLLFMYLVILLQNIEMAFCLPRIIEDNCNPNCQPFGLREMEGIVFYSYKKKTTQTPKYAQCEEYLLKLVQLLPQNNKLKCFIESQVQLAKIFTDAGLNMIYPISGPSGVISKREVYGLMENLSIKGLQSLNLSEVQQSINRMQMVISQSRMSVTLYDLYEKMVSCLLSKGLLKEALGQIETLLSLDPLNQSNIIYLLLVFRRISGQFIDENKQLILQLIEKSFLHPQDLLNLFQQLTTKQLSNDQQKEMLISMACTVLASPEELFDKENILFDESVTQYLQDHSQKLAQFARLLKYQFTHLVKSNQEFQKSIDFPIFHMIILHKPQLFINYFAKAKNIVNLRQVRCFLSYLSKYEIFNSIKVLQFAKRFFNAFYESQRDSIEVTDLIKTIFATPLSETISVQVLPADTENLNRLSKAVQKFKGKLKSKLTSSQIKRRQSEIKSSVPLKYTNMGEWLKDYSKYAPSNDYPFNDSDGYIDKEELLVRVPYKQASPEGSIFNFHKFLRWMLIRSDQPIEHYLVNINQVEADQQMKKLEEALKMSFRKSPYDKTVRDFNKPLVKVFSQTQQMFAEGQEGDLAAVLNLPYVSAIPVVPNSAISEGANVWFQEVQEVNLAPTLLKDSILSTLQRSQQGKVTFKIDLLRNYGSGHELDRVLPQTIRQIYKDEKIDYPTMLLLLKQIHSFFPKLTLISESFLEIYTKIDQLQRKLSLDLPVRNILPFDGLRIKDKDNSGLFSYLKDNINGYLDENNVHTLSRILSLAFKKPEFQLEIINEFLKRQVRELQSVDDESLDERMKIEKIGAFAQKMPVVQLKSEVEKMISALSAPKRIKVASAMAAILRLKNDHKGAQQLQSRWLQPQPAQQ